jgi:type IV secretion system protein VirB6
LIGFFAFNWGSFSSIVVKLFDSGVSELAATALSANPIKLPVVGSGSLVIGALQGVLNEVLLLGDHFIGLSSFPHIGPALQGLLIYASGAAVIGLAFFFITVSKIGIALILCMAPVLIPLVLFKRTKEFFNQAIGLLSGFSMSIIFVSLSVSFAITLVHWSIPMEILNQELSGNLHAWVSIVFSSLLGIFIIKTANDLGNRIGGSCASFDAGSAVGATMGAAFGVGRMGRNFGGSSLDAAKSGIKTGLRAKGAINTFSQGAAGHVMKGGSASKLGLMSAGRGVSSAVKTAARGYSAIRNKLWK